MAQILTIKYSKAKTVAVSAVDTTSYDKMAKVELRAYPNNRVVMRPSEKFEAKAAGQKCSEAWFSPR